MLRVLTPARVRALVSAETARTRLGLTSGQDALLTELILEASARIEGYLGRVLARQQYIETLRSDGQVQLQLHALPVETPGLAVTLDGDALEGVYLDDPATGLIRIDSAGWSSGSFRPALDMGWPSTAGVAGLFTDYQVHGSGPKSYAATFWAGYILPSQIADWSTGTKALGAWVRPSSAVAPSIFRFECTTAGTTGASQPDWATATEAGDTVVDNTATWTAREAVELPAHLSRACIECVREWYGGEGRDPKTRELQRGDKRIVFGADRAAVRELPDAVIGLLLDEVRL